MAAAIIITRGILKVSGTSSVPTPGIEVKTPLNLTKSRNHVQKGSKFRTICPSHFEIPDRQNTNKMGMSL